MFRKSLFLALFCQQCSAVIIFTMGFKFSLIIKIKITNSIYFKHSTYIYIPSCFTWPLILLVSILIWAKDFLLISYIFMLSIKNWLSPFIYFKDNFQNLKWSSRWSLCKVQSFPFENDNTHEWNVYCNKMLEIKKINEIKFCCIVK